LPADGLFAAEYVHRFFDLPKWYFTTNPIWENILFIVEAKASA
jgi:hypothetical protein